MEPERERPRLDYENFVLPFQALLDDKDRSGRRKPADQQNVFTKVEIVGGKRSNVLRTPKNAKGLVFTSVMPKVRIRNDLG